MRRTQVLSAAAALLFVATAAQAQRGRGDRHGRQDQHAQPAPQDQQRQGGGDRRGGEAQPRGNDQGRADQGRADQARAEQARADQARAEQARASAEQQRRTAQQNDQWRDQQNREAQQRDQLDRARRAQQEEQFQREQQSRTNRAYDRDRDDRPYDRDRDDRFAHAYRYNVRGVYRETNQYGADVLRQAVDQGYEQGYRAGLNDRREGEGADYRRALDFQSGGFGYSGAYVPADDYSYYFREGFQRGYDDGYWSRSQYGTFSNGKAAILGAIALGILGLTMIH